MKKYLICSMVVMLAVMIAVATPITTGLKTQASSYTPTPQVQAIPLSTQSIVPLSTTIPDGASDQRTAPTRIL